MFLEPQKYKVYADCRLFSYSSPSTPTQNPSRQTVSNRLQTRGERIYLNAFSNHFSGSGCQQGKNHWQQKKAFQCGSVVKSLPANVRSGDVGLIPDRRYGGGEKDPLQQEMATHFSILAWETPWWAAVHRVTKNLTQLATERAC